MADNGRQAVPRLIISLLASFLFAVALVHANGPRRIIPLVWARVNKPSADASSITLTGSAFVEMGTPTTRLKMMMDPEMNAGVTSYTNRR